MSLFKTPKTALALAGGGARGAYHLGAWRALRELKVPFDIVTGTSVGALTGGIIAQGDYQPAEEIFTNIKNSDVFDLPDNFGEVGDFVKYVAKNGGLDTSPLRGLLERCVDENKVRRSGKDFGLVIVRRNDLFPTEATLKTIPKGELIKYMLASASIYPFFTSQEIDGEKYVDGGIFNNLPIALADDMGADNIIAIDLEAIGVEKEYTGGLPVRRISPSWPLGSIVNFEAESARRNLELGYLDTMKAYRQYDGVRYAIYPGELQAEAAKCPERLRQVRKSISELPSIAEKGGSNFLVREYDAHRNDRRLLMALLETSAAIFEIDPLVPYSVSGLKDAVLKAYKATGPLALNLAGAKQLVAGINRRSAVVSMARNLASGGSQTELRLLATALPQEFTAAAYLATILCD